VKREHTKLPACLNETKFRVVDKEWDSSPEEIRLRLKIGVKDGNIVTLLHVAAFHAFFQSPCFVPVSVVPHLVLYVHPFARPSTTFHLHQLLHFVHSFTIPTINPLTYPSSARNMTYVVNPNSNNMRTLIVGLVESSRTCMMILSEGQERPQAAPIDS